MDGIITEPDRMFNSVLQQSDPLVSFKKLQFGLGMNGSNAGG